MSTTTDILMSDRASLRGELAHLKDCQLRYFSLAVTATGVLISIGTQLPSGRESPVYYLAPLLIIVPCWWIFFDKAATITRIVGYLRLLDDFARYAEEAHCGPRFLGWETSLQLRRGDKTATRPAGVSEWKAGYRIAFTKVLPLNTTHRYWAFTWYTFFLLASTCLALASTMIKWAGPTTSDRLAWVLSVAVVAVAASYNLYLVGDLSEGRRSYEKNYLEWCRIHKERPGWVDFWVDSGELNPCPPNPSAGADG